MAIDIRVPTDADLPAMFRRDEEAFGMTRTEEERALIAPELDLDRFRLAVDGDDLVGLAGSFEKTLTLPGGALAPVGGTTWVSVAPTHRRRGLLRTLMEHVHDDIRSRDEHAAVLLASEGGIYERFGYGVATRWRVVEIDRHRAQLQPQHVPEPVGVRIVDPLAELDRIVDVFDRHQRSRVGEISRDRDWIEGHLKEELPQLRCALHADGFAFWKISMEWGEGQPNHELRLLDLVAVTPEAHAALWHTVLSHDLVGPIRSRNAMSLDDPLQYLLTDPRALRTVALNDMLWVCPFDVPALFEARSYRVDDQLVVEVDGDRWQISSTGVSPTGDAADLTVTLPALGALSLGGVSATELSAGRRLTASDPSTLQRADALFGWSPLAHCSTGF